MGHSKFICPKKWDIVMSQKIGHCKFQCHKKWDIVNLYVPKSDLLILYVRKNGTFKIYMSQKMRHCKFICPKKWEIVNFYVPKKKKKGTF